MYLRPGATLNHNLRLRFLSWLTEPLFLQRIQLTFTDSQVADFLKELGANLDGHLALLDAVSRRP